MNTTPLCHNAGPAFKLGIVGGIGPAATVDFMSKIIRNTEACCDQEHLRLVVEHNPQIPDRTANLLGGGADPTQALYEACKRLELNEATHIALPCNTAHAYIARIQPRLSVPIVNMLAETVAHIGRHWPGRPKVGLLATSGTIASGVYHEAAAGHALDLIMPDASHQAYVMEAIYGERGVKAGYVDGACKEALLRAMAHLAERGAGIVILGCTELPLILTQHAAYRIGAHTVALLDPTELLARHCVVVARAHSGAAQARINTLV
ncbi:aspartate/glutamate racemase family protein [Massilia sp. erpn]|uniref:aspartate/glutamate racemase family protein n=1 Tax=Massilia sp. erpn TaxID=2738142 RepID=UPI0021069037|nr:amino acid racemase [Massilia sp. erpn]